MNETNTKYKIITSLFWKFMERGGTFGVQFLVQLILARLLLPEDYGLIVIVAIFISIANLIIQNSFNTALIQKKDANETDYSSVFYLSIGLALILYLLIFFLSPIIANFYANTVLIWYLRIFAISLFFGAFNSIQNAIIAKNMEFKKLFFGNFVAIIISGTIGIVMAYSGYGGWALIFLQLSNQIAITIILWFVVKWRPKFLFSWLRVRELFSFGWKILISSILFSIYENLRSLIIGKFYQPDTLGYYNKGKEFPKYITDNINGTIQTVIFPALAALQDDKKQIKNMMQRSIISSAFLLFPIL
ncbi:MAG: lipopolysaccharide biosynthesis protein, partial [Actinomycetia bacterium]|nr:lipopolysaccharide biosynthesis protein [Actinomycetes bacterium]